MSNEDKTIDTAETPDELAKVLWDTTIQHLQQASEETNPVISNAYVAIGELSLKATQFVLANQAWLAGAPEDVQEDINRIQAGLPPGAPPLPSHIAPRVWGSES